MSRNKNKEWSFWGMIAGIFEFIFEVLGEILGGLFD